MYLPSTRERKSNRKNSLNGCRLDHKTEYLLIVKTQALVKSLGHEMTLVSGYSAIRITFDPKDPRTTNDILSKFERDQLPCMI